MTKFDKRMALDVVEDALLRLHSPEDRGVAVGLCGAFYMCGLLDYEEWQDLLQRIPDRAAAESRFRAVVDRWPAVSG